jgi:hypothetical protein
VGRHGLTYAEAWQVLTGNVLGVDNLVKPGAIGEGHSQVSDEWDV